MKMEEHRNDSKKNGNALKASSEKIGFFAKVKLSVANLFMFGESKKWGWFIFLFELVMLLALIFDEIFTD
jgi:hypothetical protein